MAEERAQRRLAAILAADVVGYSRLLERDEAGTLAVLKQRRRDTLNPLVAEHRGRIVKVMGDGVLVEFGSAVNAVACAVELQKRMSAANDGLAEDRQVMLRIGINLGDVVVEGGDLYGDGVVIAVRLQAMAEPGGICVAGAVHDQVGNKLPLAFEDLGPCEVKNIAKPVQVLRVCANGDRSVRRLAERPSKQTKLSIAVLPFTNMSGDPEQEYFSDGITEDIITDLSKVSTLNVLSRNTTFTLKGKAVDIGQIAQRLKVGYVVEGSVRKAGGRVRITAQLIDASKDSHVWGERYDRDLNDIFALQDEIAQAIVAALKIRLLPEEKKAIETRSTHSPEAYRNYLLGRHYHTHQSGKNLEIALRFCQRAVEIDAQYAHAWALIALCQADLHFRGKSEDSGLSAADKALSLNPGLADAHAARGRALAELGRFDEALTAHEESLRLDPDSYDVRFCFGRTCAALGRHAAAIEHYERAAELLETDFKPLSLACPSYASLGRHDEQRSTMQRAFARIEKVIAQHPDDALAVFHGAVILAYLGEQERAKEWASRALILDPDDAIGHLNVAAAFAKMGEPEQALRLLEACYRRIPPEVIRRIVRSSPFFAPLHDDPRYQALIAREEARLAAAAPVRGGG